MQQSLDYQLWVFSQKTLEELTFSGFRSQAIICKSNVIVESQIRN